MNGQTAADDPFQSLLELEDEYYKEGYEAGVTDSMYAGMIEGRVFGIEKGYAKALELAKLHGRALVWRAKLGGTAAEADQADEFLHLGVVGVGKNKLSTNSRLRKNVENLVTLTDGSTLPKDNTDEAVTEFDERLAKSKTKAKVIANVTGEELDSTAAVNTGIEDATGLNARR